MTNIRNSYAHWLNSYEWDYFCTFTTKYELTSKSARRLMGRYSDIFQRSAGASFGLFWVLEPYELKDGCHLHGLLKLPTSGDGPAPLFEMDDRQKFDLLRTSYQVACGSKFNRYTKKFEPYHRVHFAKYRPNNNNGGGGGYCTKYIMKEHGNPVNADFDILGKL